MVGFSVLMSVYHKEVDAYLDRAIFSVWEEQVLKPSQIVLVVDGPIGSELEVVLDKWSRSLEDVLSIVRLERNVGLAAALNEGLKHCKFDLVARMDTDDISVSDRFEKQVSFMVNNPEVSVSSGLIEEWSQDFSYKISERRLPLHHQDVVKFSKKRCPISHPAAIYRKENVIRSGGYPLCYPEDYPLWGGMLHAGYKFSNLPYLLLRMRVGNALVERRGKEFLKGEILVFKYLREIGWINNYEFMRNILLRYIVRRGPAWFKRIAYKSFR